MTASMGKKRDRMDVVQFHCPECDHRWSGQPGRVVDVPDKSHHPWDYFAECPDCGAQAHQDRREQALLKAWANATGPRTPEGIANTSRNLEGHPTPEESRRTRFNAMKHGAHAETAKYFPARPGKYPDCDGCPYYVNCGLDGNIACQRKTELFLRHHVAFDAQDPGMLQDIRASMHAAVSAILDMIMQSIISRGVEIETPAWHYDKDGGFHLAEYHDENTGQNILIKEVRENPLLKRMSEIIKATGMTLSDSGMTMAAQQQQDAIEGHLAGQQDDRGTMLEYQRQQAAALENMSDMLARSAQRRAQDPILVEHQTDGD
jgi:hypothetical protein